jgi:hypothetical protein
MHLVYIVLATACRGSECQYYSVAGASRARVSLRSHSGPTGVVPVAQPDLSFGVDLAQRRASRLTQDMRVFLDGLHLLSKLNLVVDVLLRRGILQSTTKTPQLVPLGRPSIRSKLST